MRFSRVSVKSNFVKEYNAMRAKMFGPCPQARANLAAGVSGSAEHARGVIVNLRNKLVIPKLHLL